MKKIVLSFLFFICVCSLSLFAVPATPNPIQVTQPDGTVITIMLRGDEHFNYAVSEDGYLIKQNDMQEWSFAKLENDEIVATNFKAKNVKDRDSSTLSFLKTQKQHADLSELESKSSQLQSRFSGNVPLQKSAITDNSLAKSFPLIGSPRSLVILVNFADKSFVVPNPQQAFSNLLNEEGYSTNSGTGSARDYFISSSAGQFQPSFDVVGPYTISNNYAYYGGSGGTQNPEEMVEEACRLADADGVDFSQYDTDGDGRVDNVFIYYAGNNQAEGAANTVWPHRYALYYSNVVLDGVRVYDYACTSELRSTRATADYMCGVGTFVHEFGHVLGLPDLYATNSSSHATLGSWDVMDYGPYLNTGRTPPSYSAYERFYLNWLTPVELNEPIDIVLDTLTTSNQAFIITQNGNHNLNGKSPNPTQFFMLENRQKKGWDTYLPGHGLLVTRVNYSQSAWSRNTVNNTASSMGVEIIKANTFNSDYLFPGTRNVTSYSPTLRNGTDIAKPLTEISEIDGIIYFKFMGGSPYLIDFSPIATAATEISSNSASANWIKNSNISSTNYYIDIYTKKAIEELPVRSDSVNFRTDLPDGWYANIANFNVRDSLHGITGSALMLSTGSHYIQTRPTEKLNSFNFVYSSTDANDSILIMASQDELIWDTIFAAQTTSVNVTDTINFDEGDLVGYTILKIIHKGEGTVYLGDILLNYQGGEQDYEYLSGYSNFDTGTDDTYVINNLAPETEYYYRLSASNGLGWSKKSNEIKFTTPKLGSKLFDDKGIYYTVYTYDGTLYVKTNSTDNYDVQLFDISGRLIISDRFVNNQEINLKSSIPSGVYIVKINSNPIKIIL